jgi:hypothetical protein
MFSLDEESAVPDSLRRWAALDSLWKIGAREEAQRLASSFVGCKACLRSELDEDGPVTLTQAYVSPDHAAPGGIAISFDWKRDGQYGSPTAFSELLYMPDEV